MILKPHSFGITVICFAFQKFSTKMKFCGKLIANKTLIHAVYVPIVT